MCAPTRRLPPEQELVRHPADELISIEMNMLLNNWDDPSARARIEQITRQQISELKGECECAA